MASERSMTADEYERIAPYLDGPSELVNGRLRLMSPTGFLHGVLANRIGGALDRYVEDHPEAGEATGAETGFRIDNPQHPVQAPDAAFVTAARVPISTGAGRNDPAMRFMHGAPDLAVEVRSPDDTIEEMQAKARRWLAAGSQEVWLVDGLRLAVEVWRPDAAPALLHMGDTLQTPGLLPGFSLDLARLFRRRRAN